MANEEQLSILKQGVAVWNKWREENPLLEFGGIDLKGANLSKATLRGVNFSSAHLEEAILSEASLVGANFFGAHLERARLNDAYLVGANLSYADLFQSNFWEAFLDEADLSGADLREAYFKGARLINAKLRWADLSGIELSGAVLREADLTGVDLTRAVLVGTNVDKTKISGSRVYGVSVWDLDGVIEEQKDLIITNKNEAEITVDNIEVAQFIYLILHNEKIRDVINTLTSKSVLILGRFALPDRKAVLDALKEKLREYDLLPIVFDFDRPIDKDLTETIKTLAGLSYFVIADVTNPKSSPLELQATVPDYQIPFVPIIQEGESPFAMMVDLQKKYDWVLNTVSYDSQETLMKILKPLIIDPAMKKRQELRLIKAQQPEIISAKDFLAKGGS
jgi:uncharacterized protein YjbI with pentapeptide repeats